MIIKEQTKSSIEPIPAGISQAIFAQVIDLGTHDVKVMGSKDTKKAHKLLIVWELPFETYKTENGEKRRSISKRYTASLHKKASLRAMLESARGKPFSDADLKAGFDISKVVGVNCQLNIVHANVDGKTYANISNVVPLGKGMAPQVLEGQPVVFNIPEAGDIELPDTLPEWIKDVIKDSDEWKARHGVPDVAGVGSEEE
jgi:hypothetical protein